MAHVSMHRDQVLENGAKGLLRFLYRVMSGAPAQSIFANRRQMLELIFLQQLPVESS